MERVILFVDNDDVFDRIPGDGTVMDWSVGPGQGRKAQTDDDQHDPTEDEEKRHHAPHANVDSSSPRCSYPPVTRTIRSIYERNYLFVCDRWCVSL